MLVHLQKFAEVLDIVAADAQHMLANMSSTCDLVVTLPKLNDYIYLIWSVTRSVINQLAESTTLYQ